MCHEVLVGQLPPEAHAAAEAAAGKASADAAATASGSSGGRWGITPFYIKRAEHSPADGARFDFGAATTARNALRVLRALQLSKSVLLEGSPGVGKTSLVTAMATASGQQLVRINLSEQTDMMDLLGADLPVEGGAPGEFAW
jgi:midasin